VMGISVAADALMLNTMTADVCYDKKLGAPAGFNFTNPEIIGQCGTLPSSIDQPKKKCKQMCNLEPRCTHFLWYGMYCCLQEQEMTASSPVVPVQEMTAVKTFYQIPCPTTTVANEGAVAATGDPHMRNMLGQKFDIKQPGEHTLIRIPRSASAMESYLLVQARAEHDGNACADMYFKALNVTGTWANAYQEGGYAYVATSPHEGLGWRKFGNVGIKVKWGHTLSGISYMNFFVRDLDHSGYDVGGVLGLDDFSEAARPVPSCAGVMTLAMQHQEVKEAVR